ncbi:membrane protein of ER body-like protein [Durio zibethinus]|uniref:Membrane protein of ER body-like protein n=1 Tax=Durio zibethinus TaxID=66656 RepID=A0A6P6ACR3_DURZI|nr:membrane protein of ER body-like protein [Durio zibethinus]
MEQQLESRSFKTTLWLDKDGEEEEEEEEGVSLLARHSRDPTKVDGATSTSSITINGELEPAPANGTTSEDQEEDKGAATADYSRRNEEVGDENEEEKVAKGEGDGIGNSVYFDKLEGIESIHRNSETQSDIPKILSLESNHQRVKNVQDQNIFRLIPAPVEQLHEETNMSSKHFYNATKADVSVDLSGETEEVLMELDVEKQNTHDLICPNCNACITRRVILRRRKPKISNKHHKPKPVKKLDLIPNSVGDGRGGDTPEIYSNVSPTPAPDEQNNGTEQEQEAFGCTSCYSLFIPIGNGCFKIFQFFRHGRQTEQAPSLQDISQRESIQSPQQISQRSNTQSPQEKNTSENIQSPHEISQKEKTQSPQEMSQKEKTQSPQGISLNDTTQTPQKVSHDEDTQSPQKRSHNENVHSPQHINYNKDAQSPQHISHNEDTQSPRKRSHNENMHSPQSPQKSHDENVHSPQSPQNSSVLDKVKSVSREKKPDAVMLQKNAGKNEIVEDIEAGVLEPTFSPRTEVVPLSQSRTQDENRGADGQTHEWQILKSIVYGGLIQSIISLGVVSSAAGAGADTLNVLALGMANLIGGLLVFIHNLRELKNDQPRGDSTEINVEEDRYQVLLGRRQNFVLHATVAILSFLIFGLVPPVVYGFSFRKSDDKDLKLAAVAGASLVCIILLALGKGHVRKPHRAYFRTVSSYVFLGITASGISYVVGEIIKKLLEKLGLFDSSSAVSMPFLETIPLEVGRASY